MDDGEAGALLSLLGTDEQGRDIWSRLMYGTRTSLTIGLVGVALSLGLGVALGGVSGFYGGAVDSVIQRIIEILRSIPTIPLWMGLAAALPDHWSVGQIYFAITVIISLIGWTELARVVRGRFLSLREEDFVWRPSWPVRRDAHHRHAPRAVVPEPHHRGDHAGHPGDDRERDLAVASSVSASGRPRSAGECSCSRRRTSSHWPSRPGSSFPSFPSSW